MSKPTKRTRTSIQIAEDLVKMTYEKSAWEWAKVLDQTDMPHHYEITFAALVSTILSLVLPFWIVTLIVSGLTDLLFESPQAKFI